MKRKNNLQEKVDPREFQKRQSDESARILKQRIRRGEAKEIWPSVEPPRFGQLEAEN